MRTSLTSSLVVTLTCAMAFAQSDPLTSGGNSDGHVAESAKGTLSYPQVNNADGSTNVLDQSAWLNGMLTCTGASETIVHAYWGTVDHTNNKSAWQRWTNFGSPAEWAALTTNVAGLNPNTTYYYRFYATNSEGDVWAWPPENFKTASAPACDNGIGPSPVGNATARMNGNLTQGQTANIYVYWGTNESNWSYTNNLGSLPEGTFYATATGLTVDTVYYYRCYATNVYGEDWAAEATNFTTEGEPLFAGNHADGYAQRSAESAFTYPQINNAGGATNVTDQGAWLNGFLTSTGTSTTIVHVYWGTVDGTNNKSTWQHWTNFGQRAEGSTLTTNVPNLSTNTAYYYRFYATNSEGDAWAWPTENFIVDGPPTVNNSSGPKPVGITTARLNGNLTEANTAYVYIYWGTNQASWSYTNNLGELSPGAFLCTVTGLTADTVYYYRCYATNAYGEDWAAAPSGLRTECDPGVWGGYSDGYYSSNTWSVATHGGYGGTMFMLH